MTSYDIVFRNVAYLGCPMATAYHLAEVIKRYLKEEKLFPTAIDIPEKLRSNSNHCIAFIRLTDNTEYDNFLNRCQGRLRFKGQLLIIEKAKNPAKHHVAKHNRYAWTATVGQEYRCQKQCIACLKTSKAMEIKEVKITSPQTKEPKRTKEQTKIDSYFKPKERMVTLVQQGEQQVTQEQELDLGIAISEQEILNFDFEFEF